MSLRNLKIKIAWIVNSQDGLDEISPYAKTNVVQLKNDKITENGDNIKFDVDITNLGSGTGKTLIKNNNSQLINIYLNTF